MITHVELNEREDVSRRWITQYGLAYFGSCIGWAAPSQLLLGNQMMLMSPDDKESALSLLMMLGGAVMVVTSVFSGQLSDRTRSRIGRRLPWILSGAIVCALCLALMPGLQRYGLLVGLWCVFQMFMAFVTNNLLTLGSDAAPQRQFGFISGVLGAAYTLGLVMGTVVGAILNLHMAYYVVAILLVLLVSQLSTGEGLQTLLVSEVYAKQAGSLIEPAAGASDQLGRDECSDPERGHSNGGSGSGEVTGSSIFSAEYRSYWWVFASRFVVHIGNYVALFYLLFYLADHIGVEDPDGGVLLLTVIYAACTVVTSIVSGSVSDRLNVRKIFVVLSSWAVGGASLIMAFAQEMNTVVVGAIVLGLAWGVFTSVDQALINESLPSSAHRARDVAIMTLTVGITNMLAGGIAAIALHNLGGYAGLYILCAIISVLGSLLVLPVKSSR